MKKNKLVILSFVIFAVLVMSVCYLVYAYNTTKEVYRIVSYGTKTIKVEVWKDNYWEGDLEVKEIPGTNWESKENDFINAKMQFVDTDGNVLKTLPEVKTDVYTITGSDSANANWYVVNGPLTYKSGEMATTMQIADPKLHDGEFVNKNGTHVDMFGFRIKD